MGLGIAIAVGGSPDAELANATWVEVYERMGEMTTYRIRYDFDVQEGDFISFDGLTGEVKLARVASKPSEILQVVNGTLPPAKSDIYRRFDKLLHEIGYLPLSIGGRSRIISSKLFMGKG